MFGKMSAGKTLLKNCESDLERAPGNATAKLCVAQYYGQAPGIAGGDKEKSRALLNEIKENDYVTYLKGTVGMDRDLTQQDRKALLKEAYEHAPKDPVILVMQVMMAANTSDFETVRQKTEELAVLNPKSTAARMALYQSGKEHAESGNGWQRSFEAQLKFLEGSTFLNGTDYRTGSFWRLGQLFEARDCLPLALEAYETAVELSSKNKDAKKSLKDLKRKMKRAR